MIGSEPIKDCPFCGGNASVGYAIANGRYTCDAEASCLSCPATIVAANPAEALELWNCRR